MKDQDHTKLPSGRDIPLLLLGVIGIGASGPIIAKSLMPVPTMIFWRNPKINEFWTKAALLTADDPPNFISDAANMANICLFWRF